MDAHLVVQISLSVSAPPSYCLGPVCVFASLSPIHDESPDRHRGRHSDSGRKDRTFTKRAIPVSVGSWKGSVLPQIV